MRRGDRSAGGGRAPAFSFSRPGARAARVCAWGASAVLAAALAWPSSGKAETASHDQRLPLVLSAEERHLVLTEMRNFLATLQTLVEALNRDDFDAIGKAARVMGSGAANEIPPATVAKLPAEFRVLAGAVHTDFDVMALDAETLADPRHTMAQLGGLMQKCNACHGIFQVQVAEPPRMKGASR